MDIIYVSVSKYGNTTMINAVYGHLAIAAQDIDELIKDILANNIDWNSDRIYNIRTRIDFGEISE